MSGMFNSMVNLVERGQLDTIVSNGLDKFDDELEKYDFSRVAQTADFETLEQELFDGILRYYDRRVLAVAKKVVPSNWKDGEQTCNVAIRKRMLRKALHGRKGSLLQRFKNERSEVSVAIDKIIAQAQDINRKFFVTLKLPMQMAALESMLTNHHQTLTTFFHSSYRGGVAQINDDAMRVRGDNNACADGFMLKVRNQTEEIRNRNAQAVIDGRENMIQSMLDAIHLELHAVVKDVIARKWVADQSQIDFLDSKEKNQFVQDVHELSKKLIVPRETAAFFVEAMPVESQMWQGAPGCGTVAVEQQQQQRVLTSNQSRQCAPVPREYAVSAPQTNILQTTVAPILNDVPVNDAPVNDAPVIDTTPPAAENDSNGTNATSVNSAPI